MILQEIEIERQPERPRLVDLAHAKFGMLIEHLRRTISGSKKG